ncbi:hypothetical protein CPT_Moonbeam159 [Bacillus phage Moonbeam]|uniref:Uncharacterized protein n=1 Tax=Bacillus phage Moonbeam TaxID=1540091 RepID=A0A0A0RNH6_9CAUD|nr:hypothetical protein CPT_Moonbeam159 [Bacillus phage Moonbeam]AIW03557.1 hypothetical protein CPT_Moonbeam159 [Bacillus phage Moonbeam]
MKIDAAKAYFILNYLQQGGEVYYEGRTLVWLDERIVDEDEKHKWVIDGLAIKGKSYEGTEYFDNPDGGKVCYMGHDMSMSRFISFVNNMSPVEYNRIIRKLGGK